MQGSNRLLLFALLVACAAAFVWLTSTRLPDLVASHFDGSGTANGFMPHGFYVWFMLGFVVVLPTFMVAVTWLGIASQKARINLPNKDYWLAPERRAQTIDFLRAGILKFGAMLVALLCYMHWLVVLANEAKPVQLDNSWFIGGMVVFLVGLLVWLKMLLGRFRKRA
jgi:hypothetical protein